MPALLDDQIDAAIARITSDDGLLPVGRIESRGQSLPCFAAAPPTLPAYFAHFCTLYGDRTFLVDGEERLSFANTLALARRCAAGLIARHGVKKGDRVGIAARNGNGWIIAYMGVLMAGGIATLLNGFWTGEEMCEAICDVDCSLVLADGKRQAQIRDCGGAETTNVVWFRQSVGVEEGLAELWGDPEAVTFPALSGEDDATILFTSGSTGRSKGAVSQHRAVVHGALNFAVSTVAALEVLTIRGTPPEHLPASLLNVPLFHVTAEVSVFLLSFAIGRKLVMMHKWDAEEAMRLIEREKITDFVGVPLMSYEIAIHPRRGDYDLSSMKDVSAGGAPRPPEQVRVIADNLAGSHPVLGYGLTETNAVGCVNIREEYLRKPASTGRACKPLVDIAILDDAGTALAQGQIGEIAIRSVACIDRYWNRPDDNARLFTADGYLRTGDLGYLDPDNYLFIVDRKKDIIIRGGENISSVEVEAALYALPNVRECAVFSLPHERYGEVPAAVVYLDADAAMDAQGLRAALAGHLASFKIPERVWLSAEPLPRLGTEKIDKRTLQQRYRALAAG